MRAATLLLAMTMTAVLGCTETAENGFGGTSGEVDDFSVELDVSPLIANVSSLSWTVDADVDDAWVEFGLDELDRVATPIELDGEFQCALVGLKPSREYQAQAVVLVDGVEHRSELLTVQTNALPMALPQIELTVDEHDDGRDGYLLTSTISEYSIVMVLDGDGEPVWWHSTPDTMGLVTRTVIAHDGESVLYLFEHPAQEVDVAQSDLVRVRLDGTDEQRIVVPGGHHDFVELPDGTVAVLTYEERDVGDGGVLIADAITEIAPDGTFEVVWRAMDEIPFDEQFIEGLDDWQMGWTHANAIDYDEDADVYHVSLRNLDTIVTVDRGSRTMIRMIGGVDSDYEVVGEGRLFASQHQFEMVDGGLLVFDNGAPEQYHSRAVEVALDDDAGTAEVVWSHMTAPAVYVPTLGDVSLTPDSDRLVTWSTAGQVDVVAPDGTVRWQLNLGLGAGLAYTVHADNLGIY